MSGLKLNAEIALDGSGFQRGLAGLDKSLGGFKNQIATIFGTLAISHLVKDTIEWAGKLQDVGDALGVSVEWLQKMQNGAATAGGKIEDLEKSMIALSQARENALREPKGENAKAFGRMGFSRSEIAALPAEQFYDRMVKLFANGGSAQLENDVVQVGGKSAKNLLAAFANQFESTVPIVSADMVQKLDNLGDKFTIFAQTLTANVAPALVSVMTKLAEFVQWLQRVGATIGGGIASKKWSWHDFAPLMFGAVGVRDFIDNLFNADAGQALLHEEAKQKNQDAAAKAANDKLAADREERRNRPPFDQSKIALESTKHSALHGSTDALLASGGFLGAGAGMINNIADEQLRIARAQLDAALAANQLLKELKHLQDIKSHGGGDDWPE